MNGEYIRTAELDSVISLAMPYLIEAGKITENMDDKTKEWAEKVIALYQEQLHYGQEIVELTDLFFKESIEYDEDAMKVLEEEQVVEVLQVLADKLIHIDDYNKNEIKAQIKEIGRTHY